MKTINSKLQKAGIETLAVLAVIFATCFTINAQGASFKIRLNGNEELASIETMKAEKIFTPKSETSADLMYAAELLEVENEEELEVETWMTEASYFGVEELKADNEEALEVENWMLEEVLFKKENADTKKDGAYQVLTDKNGKTVGIYFPGAQFGRRTFILVEMEEPELELEGWMLNPRIWVR